MCGNRVWTGTKLFKAFLTQIWCVRSTQAGRGSGEAVGLRWLPFRIGRWYGLRGQECPRHTDRCFSGFSRKDLTKRSHRVGTAGGIQRKNNPTHLTPTDLLIEGDYTN